MSIRPRNCWRNSAWRFPAGHAALSVDEAVAAAGKLPGPLYVVKSQIHAGGRGKGKFKELGRRCQGRRPSLQDHRGGARQRHRHAGQHAGDDPDGRCRQAGEPPVHHRRRGHREGILSVDGRRSRHRPGRHDRVHRRRHGHRDGGARHAGEDHHDHDRSGRRLPAAPRPRRGVRAEAEGRAEQAGRQGRLASCTTPSWPPICRCWRSTRWWRLPTATSWCSTRR